MVDKDCLLSEIILKLKSEGIDYPLALVGSAVVKENYNDLDLLMIVDDFEMTKALLLNCFSNYNVEIVDDAFKIINYSEKEVSIALYCKKDIETLINRFLIGDKILTIHKTWSIGYWICESLIYNLSNMIIINDKNNFLKKLQSIVKKISPYAKEAILRECIEEIEIKKDLISKQDNKNLEYSYLKNDIILAMIRGYFIVNNKYLTGFKNITNIINNCDSNYRDLLYKFIMDENNEALTISLELFKKSFNWNNKIYLGTWQFSGDFKKLSPETITELINYAKLVGIKKFDTALVYGNGNVEKLLSTVIEEKDEVLTKIPAKIKPSNDLMEKIDQYYTYEYMYECVCKSLKNLNRKYLDICLLHNWVADWNNHMEIIDWLLKLKKEGLVKRIGISLPNFYNNTLPDNILSLIDVIEVPYNSENNWIEQDLKKYKSFGIEIILRSLFLQGKSLKNNGAFYKTIIENAMNYNTSMVIGMTTKKQIDDNIKVLEGRK